jgi:hypothetical protein
MPTKPAQGPASGLLVHATRPAAMTTKASDNRAITRRLDSPKIDQRRVRECEHRVGAGGREKLIGRGAVEQPARGSTEAVPLPRGQCVAGPLGPVARFSPPGAERSGGHARGEDPEQQDDPGEMAPQAGRKASAEVHEGQAATISCDS